MLSFHPCWGSLVIIPIVTDGETETVRGWITCLTLTTNKDWNQVWQSTGPFLSHCPVLRAFTRTVLPVRCSLSLYLASILILAGDKEHSSLLEVLGNGRERRAQRGLALGLPLRSSTWEQQPWRSLWAQGTAGLGSWAAAKEWRTKPATLSTRMSNSGVTSCQSTNKTSLSADPTALSVLSLLRDHHIGEASAPWSSAIHGCHKCEFFVFQQQASKVEKVFFTTAVPVASSTGM